MKLHQGAVFIDGMVNSTEVVVYHKTKFVKIVRNQLLFRNALMLCANWYYKIIMWPIVRLRRSEALVGPAYTQYYVNIWLSKKYVRVETHTICQSLKERLVSIGREKCSKNTIAVLRNASKTSWQVMNHGFTRMSPKVNSNRLYGRAIIQQKLLAHEALPSKCWPVFFGKTGHVAIAPLE